MSSNQQLLNMKKVYSATAYFIIGYTIIIASMTTLSFIPGQLRASLGMVLAAIIFVDMSYRFFRKNVEAGASVDSRKVIYLMTYWSILSISLDVLIMVIILPLIATGAVNWAFFTQQPSVYWLQFPMFFIFGFASQAIYNRVISITKANIDRV